MRIEVTAEDIADGIRDMGCSCPIALACKRAGHPNVFIETTRITQFDDTEKVHAVLPIDARAFIEAFDAGRPVSPFSFDVEWEP